MFNTKNYLIAIFAAALTACGGGGGGESSPAAAGPVTSTLSFPISTGVRSLAVNGQSKTFNVTGSCTGTGTRTSSALTTPSLFEGVNGFSGVTTITMTLAPPCTSLAQTSTNYVDSNYVALGFNSVGVNYGVYLTPPVYPTSVSVGATGVVGTAQLYTNSAKNFSNGAMVISYVVTADTATTAILNVISKIYDKYQILTLTEQDFYRIDANGKLTPLSVDIFNETGYKIIFTYN